MSTTVHQLLREARGRLQASNLRPPSREARLLLGHALGLDESRLLARDVESVPAPAERRFQDLLERRLRGEPVAYLIGEREFWGRSFRVDRRVLIPRPETEHLIEIALSLELPRRARIADLGTGSGCIAVTLALEMPSARICAVDLSAAALAVAKDNARRLGAAIELVGGDLTAPLRLGEFDLVVSNPPYIDPRDASDLSPEITGYEPHLALFAPHGTEALTRILAAAEALRPSALLLVEIGQGQLPAIARLAPHHGLRVMEARADLAGTPRSVLLRRG